MVERGSQHTESSEVEKGSVKISKTLNSEYMRNRNMIETTERNVKYVCVSKNMYYVGEIDFLICRNLNNVQSFQGVLIRAVPTNLPRRKLCNNIFFAI